MPGLLRRAIRAVLLQDERDDHPEGCGECAACLVSDIRDAITEAPDMIDAYLLAEWIVHTVTVTMAERKHAADNQRPENRQTIVALERTYNAPAYGENGRTA